MTDNESLRPEDFEPHRIEPDHKPVRAGFAEIWKEQPGVRLVVILLPVIAIVVLVLGVFGHSKPPETNVSKIASGSNVITSGVGPTSPEYAKKQEEENARRLIEAQNSGGSVIPTPTPTAPPAIETKKNDVLTDFVPPPVNTQPVQPNGFATAVTPPPTITPIAAPAPKLDPQQIQALAAEMRAIMGTPAARTTIIKGSGGLPPSGEAAAAEKNAQAVAPPVKTKLLVLAGTVLYAQTITEADSDIPAPLLVSMLSGPFSGGRAIGTFQKADDYLILAFGTIIKDKKEYKVNALAIDPDTTLSGLETDIDHHYFERFVLPAAAAFISGVGNYAQQAGSTVTSATYGVTQSYPPLSTHQEILAGLGQSANAIAGAIQSEANVQPTIYIASGTGIGIMFINSVREPVE